MKTYLWLDDIRDPNMGVWRDQYIPEFNPKVDEIVWVKEFPEFVDYIREFGLPDEIFFDHDLGDDELGTGPSKVLILLVVKTSIPFFQTIVNLSENE